MLKNLITNKKEVELVKYKLLRLLFFIKGNYKKE